MRFPLLTREASLAIISNPSRPNFPSEPMPAALAEGYRKASFTVGISGQVGSHINTNLIWERPRRVMIVLHRCSPRSSHPADEARNQSLRGLKRAPQASHGITHLHRHVPCERDSDCGLHRYQPVRACGLLTRQGISLGPYLASHFTISLSGDSFHPACRHADGTISSSLTSSGMSGV